MDIFFKEYVQKDTTKVNFLIKNYKKKFTASKDDQIIKKMKQTYGNIDFLYQMNQNIAVYSTNKTICRKITKTGILFVGEITFTVKKFRSTNDQKKIKFNSLSNEKEFKTSG